MKAKVTVQNRKKQDRAKVLAMLQLDNEAIYTLIEETGVDYAITQAGNKDDDAVKWLTTSEAYWDWFENQWCLIDAKYLCEYGHYPADDALAVKILRQQWEEAHHISNMVATIGKSVWAAAYDNMITELNKEVHQKQRQTCKQ